MKRKGIILSDVDGTFLDATYRPALSTREFADVLAQWRVVWATSRTVAEIQWLQRLLHHEDDAIGENGAVCLSHSASVAERLGNARRTESAYVSVLAPGARETLALVNNAFASVGRSAQTFLDVTPAALAKRAHYRVQDAMRAQRRDSSVVLMDTDVSDPATRMALAWLSRNECNVSTSNRWTTVVRGANKGLTALRWLGAIDNDLPVIAIGDGDNDESLLRAADFKFVIRRPSGAHHPALAAIPGAYLLEAPGTHGWLEMLRVLDSHTRELVS